MSVDQGHEVGSENACSRGRTRVLLEIWPETFYSTYWLTDRERVVLRQSTSCHYQVPWTGNSVRATWMHRGMSFLGLVDGFLGLMLVFFENLILLFTTRLLDFPRFPSAYLTPLPLRVGPESTFVVVCLVRFARVFLLPGESVTHPLARLIC